MVRRPYGPLVFGFDSLSLWHGGICELKMKKNLSNRVGAGRGPFLTGQTEQRKIHPGKSHFFGWALVRFAEGGWESGAPSEAKELSARGGRCVENREDRATTISAVTGSGIEVPGLALPLGAEVGRHCARRLCAKSVSPSVNGRPIIIRPRFSLMERFLDPESRS